MTLRRNISWNVLEVIVSSLSVFVLYRIIVLKLGVSAIGVWSLVLATTALAKFADAGLSSGLGRYVALARSKGNERGAIPYVETALLANASLYVFLAGILYWPAYYGLSLVTHGEALRQARLILPAAVIGFALTNISAVLTAALIGLNRSDRKSQLILSGVAVQLILTLALIDRFGLLGLALAQLGQGAVVVVIGWLLVLRIEEQRLMIPYKVSRPELKELIGFGARLQVLNVASFLNEPAIKFVVSATGGVAALGVFEMAWRLILQVRQLIVAPTQNLVPLFAVQDDPKELQALYLRATATTGTLGMAALASVALLSPLIIAFWVGRLEWLFVEFVLILVVGWAINIASVPSYLLAIARGRLFWNILSSGLATLLACTLGVSLGWRFGSVGAAIGASGAIGTAALLCMVMNARAFELRSRPAPRDLLAILQLKRSNA